MQIQALLLPPVQVGVVEVIHSQPHALTLRGSGVMEEGGVAAPALSGGWVVGVLDTHTAFRPRRPGYPQRPIRVGSALSRGWGLENTEIEFRTEDLVQAAEVPRLAIVEHVNVWARTLQTVPG